MIRTEVLILGGGVSGLSVAWHLERMGAGGRCLLVEKEPRVGGTAATVAQDGFLFDHTGHLLHLHDPYGKRLVQSLLRGNLALHERAAWIYSHKTYTRYPFQANTYGLPRDVVAECVAGFAKNLYRPPRVPARPQFEEWCARTFGDGICRHFMYPYNQKLWRRPLSELGLEWQGRFLPKPSAEEVLYGALTDQRGGFGYNAFFRYPKRGGSQVLPDALARTCRGIRTDCRASFVDLDSKVAVIDGLGEVGYERLVNTTPLPEFLSMARPLPQAVSTAKANLRWVGVRNLNVGVKRARVSDKHWIYFPEKEFPFYRVGFNSNFSAHVAPRGTSSMYIEVARRPDEQVRRDALEKQCLAGLRRCGVLRSSD
jgi:protoporphyrinogen oxidase